MKNRHIFIATPAFDGKVHVQFALSLAELYVTLVQNNVGISSRINTSGSLLVAERNKLLEEFIRDEHATHILFIDSDLGFPAQAVLAMLDSEKDFVAGVYPARNSDSDDNQYLYRPKLIDDSNLIVSDKHLLGAEYIPTGFTMLSREAVLKMRDKFPELYFQPKAEARKNEHAYCLFDTEVWDGEFWGEDYVFCRRARQAGIDIWVDPLIEFDHAGRRGMLMKYLQEQQKNYREK